MIGIISFVTFFGLYQKLKREGLITSSTNPRVRREEWGFTTLMIGLILTVSAYGFSFILTSHTDFCIQNEVSDLVIAIKSENVTDSLNAVEIENCSKNSDYNMVTYYIGFTGIISLAISSYLMSSLSFRNPNRGI